MQKLDGLTLRAVLDAKGRLPLATAYSIAIDLLDALDHAHSLGIIHRDVKPENIFLHRDPSGASVTKLLDFGVVHFLAADGARGEGRFVGTLRYAAPEQLRGGPITPRADLYAAALVLYESIAGRGPFDSEGTDRAIADAHMDKPAPPLTAHARVPATLDALLASALAKDPERRPGDAFTFAARLRELARDVVGDSPASLRTPPPPARVSSRPPVSFPRPATTSRSAATLVTRRPARVTLATALAALAFAIAAILAIARALHH
jgi:serine/threonine-protein kinase